MFSEVRVSSENVQALEALFDNIRPDPYSQGGYRFRALNRYWVSGSQLIARPKELFYQSKQINRLWGGMMRDFSEATVTESSAAAIQLVALDFLSQCDCNHDDIELQMHPIRTICSDKQNGEPAPEGFHTDGYLYSSICVVRRDSNVVGGQTLLRFADSSELIYENTVDVGSMLVFNDVSLRHYTTPIKSATPGNGTRDVIVFTVSPRRGRIGDQLFTR